MANSDVDNTQGHVPTMPFWKEQPLMVSAECQEAIDQRHRCLGSLLNSSLDYERLALESFLMGSVVARDIETLVRRDLGDSMESEFCSHFKLGDDRRCLEDLKELCFAKEEAEKGNTRSRVEVANTLLDVFNYHFRLSLTFIHSFTSHGCLDVIRYLLAVRADFNSEQPRCVRMTLQFLKILSNFGLEFHLREVVNFADGKIMASVVQMIHSRKWAELQTAVRTVVQIFIKYPKVQRLLLEHRKIAALCAGCTDKGKLGVEEVRILTVLASSDDPDIRQELMACNVPRMPIFFAMMLRNKCENAAWAQCCDRIASHRSAKSSVKTIIAAAGEHEEKPAATCPEVEDGIAVLSEGGDTDDRAQLVEAEIEDFLKTVTGRYQRTFGEEQDCELMLCQLNTLDRKSKVNPSTRLDVMTNCATSPFPACRFCSVKLADEFLVATGDNSITPYVARLDAWRPAQRHLQASVSSQNSVLAQVAREVIMKHMLGPISTLQTLCVQVISECFMAPTVKSRVHQLPTALLRQIVPMTQSVET